MRRGYNATELSVSLKDNRVNVRECAEHSSLTVSVRKHNKAHAFAKIVKDSSIEASFDHRQRFFPLSLQPRAEETSAYSDALTDD